MKRLINSPTGTGKKMAWINMFNTRHLPRVCLITGMTLAGLYSQQSWALDCTALNTSLSIDVGTIVIQRDAADLTALTSIKDSAIGGYRCVLAIKSEYISIGVKAYGTGTGKHDGSAMLFKSNVSGVGFAIGGSASNGTGWTKGETEPVVIFKGNSDFFSTQPILRLTATIQLFKIDALASGKLSGKIGALVVNNLYPPIVWGTEIPIYITGNITALACSLNSTSISVPLGNFSNTQFTGVGTTLGDKSFNVGLTCDKDAKINASLDGTQNADISKTSVLALTNAGQSGTATGVGVQLLYGGVPLEINKNILLKTSDGGLETLPFTARYYQTKTAVGGGLANTSATLNITYQ